MLTAQRPPSARRLPYGTSLHAHQRSRRMVGQALAGANVFASTGYGGPLISKRRHLGLRRAYKAIELRGLGPYVKRRRMRAEASSGREGQSGAQIPKSSARE